MIIAWSTFAFSYAQIDMHLLNSLFMHPIIRRYRRCCPSRTLRWCFRLSFQVSLCVRLSYSYFCPVHIHSQTIRFTRLFPTASRVALEVLIKILPYPFLRWFVLIFSGWSFSSKMFTKLHGLADTYILSLLCLRDDINKNTRIPELEWSFFPLLIFCKQYLVLWAQVKSSIFSSVITDLILYLLPRRMCGNWFWLSAYLWAKLPQRSG